MSEHVKADWFFNESILPDGSYIDNNGNIGYIKDGKWHREDGPAMVWADGSMWWYKNDELHREDGPAVEWANGDKAWYRDGKRHREDGPAAEYADGRKEWWVDGKWCTEEDYETALFAYRINKVFQ